MLWAGVALLVIASVVRAQVLGYRVDPVKARWSAWAGHHDTVSQTVVCNFDSLSYVELFAGAKGNGGLYTATVYDGNTQLMTSDGTQHLDCSWIKFDNWNSRVAFTKGKEPAVRFTLSGSDSGI